MSVPQKDDNGYGTWFGISSVDGVTPVQIKFNPANKGMKIDTTHTIEFTPPKHFPPVGDNSVPVVKGVSSANAKTILPFYVYPTTGAVLIAM